MLSHLTRRVFSSALRAPPSRLIFSSTISSPIIARRTFASSKLLAAAAKTATKPASKPAVKAKAATKAATAGRRKSPIKKAAAKPKKKAGKKVVVKAAKKAVKKKVVPKPIVYSRLVKPPPRKFSAYSLFVQEKAKGMSNSVAQSAPLVAQEWKALSEAQKEDYRRRAEVIREEYLRNFDVYMKTVDPLTLLRYNRERRKAGKVSVRFSKSSDEPKRHVPFFGFLGQLRAKQEYKSLSAPELAREGGRQWQSFSVDEKARYKTA